jgi:TolB-like protein
VVSARALAAALLLLAAAAAAQAQTGAPAPVAPGESTSSFRAVEVDAEGTGPSRDAAIDKALANALRQETGTTVTTETGSLSVDAGLRTAERSEGAATVGVGGASHPVAERGAGVAAESTLQGKGAETATVSGTAGRILRYSVISVSAAPEGGFVARVHATLELARREGGSGDSRKRLAIAGFASDKPTPLAQALHDQLVIDLTQSRRFAVVDREHDSAWQSEIDTVRSGDAAPAERARAGQVLGADFLLLGTLHVIGSRTTGSAARTDSHVLELTGEVVTHRTASTLRTLPGSATAEFELMEVGTRQVLLADRSTVTGSNVEALAERISGALIEAIYPARLVKTDDPQALVLNEGGAMVHVGQRFRIMAEGTEMFDPYTHESLGRQERQAGEIEVSEVGPRMSTARLVTGAVPEGGGVLRPEAPPPAPPPAPRRVVRRAAAPPPEPDHGVRLPFDH